MGLGQWQESHEWGSKSSHGGTLPPPPVSACDPMTCSGRPPGLGLWWPVALRACKVALRQWQAR
eukprot:911293-Alexandrium_andersonii.AAC.1